MKKLPLPEHWPIKLGLLLVSLTFFITLPVSAREIPEGDGFVQRAGSQLMLDGKPFRYAGTNNYYLMYKSQFMVDDVLETAASNNFNVVRTWGFLDIGNQDGSNSTHGIQEGIYFHYWDGDAPAYNDGADGLEKLDYVIYKAGQENIRLVIPFTNNWSDFGGIDQYVRWAEGSYHDDFYIDPQIRHWYKAWVTHLLNRTNSYTGVQYKDDLTIMMWELANEPRCKGSGLYPPSPTCSTETLLDWADEMSAHVASLAPQQLISVGDEGFFCDPAASDWTINCSEGVDTVALASLDHIDVLSVHLYPDHWDKSYAWGTEWIKDHIRAAKKVGKPVILGEFGVQNKSVRNAVYKEWTDTFFRYGGNGAMYWILSGYEDSGSLYPDYDGFTVYCPSPVCTTIGNFAQMMTNRRWVPFGPVADHDQAVTPFETAVSLTPLANDIAYAGTRLNRRSIDLDPSRSGQQTAVQTPTGEFILQRDGSVQFTPASGSSGTTTIQYTIADRRGRLSNMADLSVIVLPDPTAAINLFSFEEGLEGWAAGSWQTDVGALSQTAAFATDGSYGLQLDAINGGWVGLDLAESIDLSSKVVLRYDLQTNAAGTSTNVALKLGDGFVWCQGNWDYVGENSSVTVELDLLNLNCEAPDLSKLNGIFIFFSGSGVFQIDHVRAE